MSQEKHYKSSCSPFVALNTGHHLLGWTAAYNSSRVAAATLRHNSLATASCRTLTQSKNTILGAVNGLLHCLSYGRQTSTLSRDESKRSLIKISKLQTKGSLVARPAGITAYYDSISEKDSNWSGVSNMSIPLLTPPSTLTPPPGSR